MAPDGSSQPAPGEVELCIEREPCQVLVATATGGAIGIPWDRDMRELADRRITVDVRPPDGAAVPRGEDVVEFHPGGGGPCSCDYATARMTLS